MAVKHVNGAHRGIAGVKKGDLPTKPCEVCGRPFTWRKKWARDWEQVKTCSDRCRSARLSPGDGPAAPGS